MNTVLKHLLAIKASTLTIGMISYLTYSHHTPIERIVDTVLYKKITVQEGFFRDPHGIYIDKTINTQGKREVYVFHEPSGLRYELSENGFPEYTVMLEQMNKELHKKEISEKDAKTYITQIRKLEQIIETQLQSYNVTQK